TSFLLVSLLIMLFLYLPVMLLIGLSFNASTMGVAWKGFTLQWYEKLVMDPAILHATLNSVVIAGVSTGLALVLGVGTALGLEKARGTQMRSVNMVMVLPLVIPEILLGVALLMVFVLCRIPLGFGTIIIGHMVFNLPLTVVIIRARLRKLDPAWEDAARDLGATSWEVLTRITLPLLRPAIWGAALLGFTVSLDDFVVTFFVAGPGSTTLPLKVFSMIKTGITPEINALSAVLVIVSMICVGLSWLFQQRSTPSSSGSLYS
ncbi:MAG TPA: ABC transporter permease, partial [Nitrospirales bacterium]|nr:ABC transporter permease [Nitrospirales bacterium]